MPKWTEERKKACIRNPEGTFKRWKGGRRKKDLAKKENTFQGIKVHIGKEFKRQRGRVAEVGETVRTKRQDGKHHKGALWYIRTSKGWRKAGTQKQGPRKPSKAMIRRVKKGGLP